MADSAGEGARPVPGPAWHLWVAAGAVFAVYAATAARDVVWGDGMEFVAVSKHLGVAHPPGYPLFTLLGHLVLLAAPSSFAYGAMALANALYGSLAALLAGVTARTLVAEADQPLPMRLCVAGPPLVVLLWGFGGPLWSASTLVEIYALSALLTSATLALLVPRASEAQAWRLVLAAFLIALNTANHLPSLALGALLAARLWQHWRRSGRLMPVVQCAALFMAVVVSLYGSLLLRASGDRPGIFWGGTTTVSALVNHVRGGEYRQTRLLQLEPGVPFTVSSWAEFAAIRLTQVGEAVDGMLGGGGTYAFLIVAVLLGGAGVHRLWAADRLLLAGLSAVIAAQTVFLLIYNIVDYSDYLVIILSSALVLVFSGVVAVGARWFRPGEDRSPRSSLALPIGVLLVVMALAGNYRLIAERNALAARPWIERSLALLPEGAAVLVHGDTDVFSMFYVQWAEGRRRDLLVYGTNFYRFPWFERTLSPQHPLRGVVGFKASPPQSFDGYIGGMHRLAIAPLRQHGPVFSTEPDEMTLATWQRRYTVNFVGPLMTPAELESLIDNPLPLMAPRYMVRIEPEKPR